MTTRSALLDANFLIAETDATDALHASSVALRRALVEHDVHVIILDVVVAETVSVLARRATEGRRRASFRDLLDAFVEQVPAERMSWVGQEMRRCYDAVIDDVRDSGGRRNFNDALMVQICHRANVGAIVSFDVDFDNVDDLVRLSSPAAVAKWIKKQG